MLGFLELFGASRPVQRLDGALRAVGVHPRLMPGAVKIAIIRQLETTGRKDGPDEAACAHAAELFGYLMHGPGVFADDNGASAAAAVEDRIAAAVGAGTGPDARLILLALHAGIIAPEVLERHQFEID
ncbi:MAG: hypothetical protein TEF_18720 [Rhizobiales bacterium NRL2]|jgi:hypothetical protein|nr:MAG: hypothetical protein TEF_18720 [Rhizobiales bacterium NRL2]